MAESFWVSFCVVSFLPSSKRVFRTSGDKTLHSRDVLTSVSLALGPGALVHVPQINVTVAERIPPRVQHHLVEPQNAFARNVLGRPSQRGKTIVDAGAIRITHA